MKLTDCEGSIIPNLDKCIHGIAEYMVNVPSICYQGSKMCLHKRFAVLVWLLALLSSPVCWAQFPVDDERIRQDAEQLIREEMRGLYDVDQIRIDSKILGTVYAIVSMRLVRNDRQLDIPPPDSKDSFCKQDFFYLFCKSRGFTFKGKMKLHYVRTSESWVLEKPHNLRDYPLQAYLIIGKREREGYVVHPR